MTTQRTPDAATRQPAEHPERVNLSLMMRNHAAEEARAVRSEIAKLEKRIVVLRGDLERLVKHAAIEGIPLDDDLAAAPGSRVLQTSVASGTGHLNV